MSNPPGFDNLVTCPYNMSHQLLPHRVQTHLVKCAKQHPQIKLEKCPFNITHCLKPEDMHQHKINCPDRANFDNYVNVMYSSAKIDEQGQPKNKIEVKPPKPNTNPFLSSQETWDDIPFCPAYDPKKEAAEKPVLRITNGMTPAQRRTFREQERQRLNNHKDFQ